MNVKLRVLCLLPLLFSPQAYGTNDGAKEKAEKRIASCYVNDLRGKSCTPEMLKKDGETLLSLYKGGDRSVLASLMRVNALSVGVRNLDTQFFSKAIQDDLDGFLSALSSTRDAKSAWLNSAVVGSACGCPGIARRSFKELRGMLKSVPQESVVYILAKQCREDLEDTNATLIFTYFPPNTFQASGGDFMAQWYSSVLYALDEKPLWPADPKNVTYRFIWMRSFHDQVSITMYVQPEGSGQIRLQILGRIPRKLESRTESLSKGQAQGVLALIEKAEFWKLETEGGPHGCDGAEWVLEGVRAGQYHIVTRWDARNTAFGKALLEMLRLSNDKTDEIY